MIPKILSSSMFYAVSSGAFERMENARPRVSIRSVLAKMGKTRIVIEIKVPFVVSIKSISLEEQTYGPSLMEQIHPTHKEEHKFPHTKIQSIWQSKNKNENLDRKKKTIRSHLIQTNEYSAFELWKKINSRK